MDIEKINIGKILAILAVIYILLAMVNFVVIYRGYQEYGSDAKQVLYAPDLETMRDRAINVRENLDDFDDDQYTRVILTNPKESAGWYKQYIDGFINRVNKTIEELDNVSGIINERDLNIDEGQYRQNRINVLREEFKDNYMDRYFCDPAADMWITQNHPLVRMSFQWLFLIPLIATATIFIYAAIKEYNRCHI